MGVDAKAAAKMQETELTGFEAMFGFNPEEGFASTKGADHTNNAEDAVFRDFGRQREYR